MNSARVHSYQQDGIHGRLFSFGCNVPSVMKVKLYNGANLNQDRSHRSQSFVGKIAEDSSKACPEAYSVSTMREASG